ncbi:MarR family transcriptional regulator [Sphingomonas crocodyli]|uniref:MarR family transcriptional regulator n=2 Tax=Sphingomonas crocodyli TaxID=1979270 RepID=A0A437LWW2_9SPHN|nr:MarR family transcriptional regulator [Sphingomonas crocodyli]
MTMSRLSPAVARTVAVLNFFADHPGQAFTLTDIVSSLKISRATCHALLAALVEAGYLYRSNSKTYLLGSALARLAEAARGSLSPLQVAAPEMRALADEFDVIVAAIFLEKDEAVVRERASSVSHLGWSIFPGTRIPLRPPFGSVFVAWSSDAEVDAWVDRALPPPSDDERRKMRESIEFVRRWGFQIALRKVHVMNEGHAQSLVYRTDQTDYLVSELDPQREYNLGSVSAPVFDPRGKIAFVIGVMGFIRPMKGSEVQHVGRRVREVCDRVTNFIGGRIP